MGRWINPDFPPARSGYIYQMRCTQGNVYLWLALDADGKIATIFFKNRLDVETVTPSEPSSAALRTPRRARAIIAGIPHDHRRADRTSPPLRPLRRRGRG